MVSKTKSTGSPQRFHPGRGGATPYFRNRGTLDVGTVLEFGERRLALYIENEGAHTRIHVTTCEIQVEVRTTVRCLGQQKRVTVNVVATMTEDGSQRCRTVERLAEHRCDEAMLSALTVTINGKTNTETNGNH